MLITHSWTCALRIKCENAVTSFSDWDCWSTWDLRWISHGTVAYITYDGHYHRSAVFKASWSSESRTKTNNKESCKDQWLTITGCVLVRWFLLSSGYQRWWQNEVVYSTNVVNFCVIMCAMVVLCLCTVSSQRITYRLIIFSNFYHYMLFISHQVWSARQVSAGHTSRLQS